MQDGTVIPIGNFGLGARLTDAVDGGQQEIMSRRGAGAGLRPERLQQSKDAGLLSGEPQRAGQAEIARGGGQGTGAVRSLTNAATFSAVPR